MDSDVNQRIKTFMDKNDISITSLSKRIGVAQTTLNRQISGDGNVTLATVCLFLDSFKDISAEWLLRGEGNILKCCEPQQQCISHGRIVGEIEMDENNRLIFKMK